MRNFQYFLYYIFVFFIFIGCTSNENDEIGGTQTYTVNDLIEIASKYGVNFQPNKKMTDFKLSHADIIDFEFKMKEMSKLKGKFSLYTVGVNKMEMANKTAANRLKTRSRAEYVKDDSWESKPYISSIYTCNCSVTWWLFYDEHDTVCKMTAAVHASVYDIYGNGMSDFLGTNNRFDDIKYVRYFELIAFYGNILYPFYKDSYEVGHFTISYEGEVYPDYPSNSFVKWYF